MKKNRLIKIIYIYFIWITGLVEIDLHFLVIDPTSIPRAHPTQTEDITLKIELINELGLHGPWMK